MSTQKTISDAARKRVTERLASFDSEAQDFEGRLAGAVSLGDGSDRVLRENIASLSSFRSGYEIALRDLLPERTVDAILTGVEEQAEQEPEQTPEQEPASE